MHRYFIAFCHVTMRHRCSKASHRPFGRMHILRSAGPGIGNTFSACLLVNIGLRYAACYYGNEEPDERDPIKRWLVYRPDHHCGGEKKITEELHGLKLQTRARKGKRERRERERKRDESALLFRTISFASSRISSLG